MHTRHKVALIASLVVVVTAIAFSLLHHREPAYAGKRLTEWLCLLDDGPISSFGKPDAYAGQDRAIEVVRIIGTNGIPTFLKLLRARDSRAKVMFMSLLTKQQFVRINLKRAADLNRAGMRGFQILGTNAQVAIPSLLADLRSKDELLSDLAGASLTYVGYQGER